LVHELRALGLTVEADLALPLNYKGVQIDRGYRIDMRVNRCVLVELKCVAKLAPIHEAQLIPYLKLTGCRVGLLLNFNVPLMKHGIKRIVNPDLSAHFVAVPPKQ